MALNDPAVAHPITLGVIVPLANKAQFRSDLAAAAAGSTAVSFQEVKRILASTNGLIGTATTVQGSTSIAANALNVHLTTEEWDYLKTAKSLLDPSIKNLVEFSQLQSKSRPELDPFWDWAATVGYFPVESSAA